MTRVKEVVTSNGVQVSKASVNHKTGDLYVDLPSTEEREKLVPLLREETLPENFPLPLKITFYKYCVKGKIQKRKTFIPCLSSCFLAVEHYTFLTSDFNILCNLKMVNVCSVRHM